MNKSWVRWLLLVLAATPALVPLMLIHDFGVDTPYWDQWDRDFAGMYVKAHQGQITFADLAAQHNEHRHLVPRIAYLGLNSLTHWNVIVELYVQWLVVCVLSAGILWLDHMNRRDSELPGEKLPQVNALFPWFLANLMLFSPMQLEIWLWGVALANILPAFFTVAAIVAARSRLGDWTRTILVILFCSAATYSAGNGALSWGLAGIVLFWSRLWQELKSRRWILATLAAACAINMSLYFVGFNRNNGSAGQNGPKSIGEFFGFVIFYAGSIFRLFANFPMPVNAVACGIIMLVMMLGCVGYFIYIWRRGDASLARRLLVWLALGGFAVLTGLLGATTRAGPDSSLAAFPTRYIAFSLYLPLALVYLVPAIVGHLQRAEPATHWHTLLRFVSPVLATLLIIGWMQTLRLSFAEGELGMRERYAAKSAVALIKILPDNPVLAALVFPRPQVVAELAPELNTMHYLRPPLIESAEAKSLLPAAGEMISVSGALERGWQASPSSFAISGWASFPDRPADAVLLCYNDSQGQPIIFGMAPVGAERKDKSMNNDALRLCGWAAEIPIVGRFGDLHSIVFSAWAFNSITGKAYPLDGSATVQR